MKIRKSGHGTAWTRSTLPPAPFDKRVVPPPAQLFARATGTLHLPHAKRA
jgi:hypothetical protein